jgi:hypothetical protein
LTVDPAQYQPLVRACQRNAAVDTMAAPGQQLKAKSRSSRLRGFRQDAAAASDDCVGGQNISVGMPRHHGPRLFLREAHRMSRRQLTGPRHFVDIGGIDPVGLQPDLPKQSEPARRSGGEYEEWRCYHRVIPADAARKSG